MGGAFRREGGREEGFRTFYRLKPFGEEAGLRRRAGMDLCFVDTGNDQREIGEWVPHARIAYFMISPGSDLPITLNFPHSIASN